MRKRILVFCLALTLILSFGACDKKTVTPVSDGFVVYFFNNDGLGLQAVPYKLKEHSCKEMPETLKSHRPIENIHSPTSYQICIQKRN